jgi:hypothetical protein
MLKGMNNFKYRMSLSFRRRRLPRRAAMAGQANDKIFTLLNKKRSMCLQIMPFFRSYLCLLNITVPIRQGKNGKQNPKS